MTTATNETKPYSYVFRFDISPIWTADGFVPDKEILSDLLHQAIGFAGEDEIAVAVISTPEVEDILDVQGYVPAGHDWDIGKKEMEARLMVATAESPVAMLNDVIAFFESPDQNHIQSKHFALEVTMGKLQKLKTLRDMLSGVTPICDAVWFKPE